MTDSVFQKIKKSYRYQINRFTVLHLQSIFLGTPAFRKLLFFVWGSIPLELRKYVRPFARLISR